MSRSKTMALAGALALVGCQNMGLYDAGPAAEARQAPPSELVAAVIQPATAFGSTTLIVDGRRWVASDLAPAVRQDELRPVGSASGVTVHARAWDRPPYDELFTRIPDDAPIGARLPAADQDLWLSYQPVIGGGGAADGAAEGGPAGH